MTTKVTIEAHAGWPVDVSFVGQASAQSAERVEPGESRYFYVHSSQDILVHEVQPGTDGLAKREGLDFGSALRLMRAGARIARKGWNGKGMWLALQRPDDNSKMSHPYVFIEYPAGHVAYPNGSRVPWLASQTDMLADDWEIVQ